jgi:predicted metal-dependent peptidase
MAKSAFSKYEKEIVPKAFAIVMGEKIERCIVDLIRVKPVFGFILTRMQRIMAPHLCPTMGVRPTADRFIQLQWNPFFVDKLTEDHLIAVLEHEVMHILNEHPLRRGGREPSRWNVACDMAINQYIKGLPDDHIPLIDGLEAERESEYYYNSDEVKKLTEKIEGQGGLSNEHSDRGDHSGWDSMDGDISAQERIRQMVKGAVEDAERQGRSLMPGWMEEMIQRIVNPPIKWNVLLRGGITQEITAQPEETFRRPHRRRMYESNGYMEDIYPGFKRKPQSELTCAIDTSASMGSQEIGEVINELNFLSRQGYYPIELIHCDTQITKIEKYTGKNEIVCRGRGGTCFLPVLEYLRDEKPRKEGFKSTLIFFTDGYGDYPADEGFTKIFNTIWVIARQGSAQRVAQFGKIIKMDDHRRA